MEEKDIAKKYAGYLVALFVIDFAMIQLDLWLYPTEPAILTPGNIMLNLIAAGLATAAEYAYISIVKNRK